MTFPVTSPAVSDPAAALSALQVFTASLTPAELDGARAMLAFIKELNANHSGKDVGAALKQWQADLAAADARNAERQTVTVRQQNRATARHHTASPKTVVNGGWHSTPVSTADMKAMTANTSRADNGEGLRLWNQFMRFIKECTNPDTHEVRQNTMRRHTTPVFCAKDEHGVINLDANGDPVHDNSNRLSAFYSAAQAKGILRKIGEEKSTDPRQSSNAKVYAVDMDLLHAAIAHPEKFAPKTVVPKQTRRQSNEVRKTTPLTPVYNDAEGMLL